MGIPTCDFCGLPWSNASSGTHVCGFKSGLPKLSPPFIDWQSRAEAAEKALAEYQRTASYEFHGALEAVAKAAKPVTNAIGICNREYVYEAFCGKHAGHLGACDGGSPLAVLAGAIAALDKLEGRS